MPNQAVKTLKATCQDILTKYLDVLSDVGCIPYSLIKDSLAHATPQQLYKIERSNPDTIATESDELWLKHCFLFKDIREDYEQGLHRDPKEWRELYLNRYQENERKRQLIKQKVKSQYNKIQNEKEKKSIKVLHGVVPITKGRSYEAARRSTMSKLFQQTKRETDKIASIYQSPRRPAPYNNSYHNNIITSSSATSSTVIRVPKPASRLTQAYRDNRLRYPRPNSPPAAAPLIAPTSRPIPSRDKPEAKKPKLNHRNEDSNHEEKKKKPAAIVNFNIFNELRFVSSVLNTVHAGYGFIRDHHWRAYCAMVIRVLIFDGFDKRVSTNMFYKEGLMIDWRKHILPDDEG